MYYLSSDHSLRIEMRFYTMLLRVLYACMLLLLWIALVSDHVNACIVLLLMGNAFQNYCSFKSFRTGTARKYSNPIRKKTFLFSLFYVSLRTKWRFVLSDLVI